MKLTEKLESINDLSKLEEFCKSLEVQGPNWGRYFSTRSDDTGEISFEDIKNRFDEIAKSFLDAKRKTIKWETICQILPKKFESFSLLPREIQNETLRFLKFKDLAKMRLVSKQMYNETTSLIPNEINSTRAAFKFTYEKPALGIKSPDKAVAFIKIYGDKLTHLNLNKIKLSNENLKTILQHTPNIEKLVLSFCKLDKDAILTLSSSKLPKLSSLKLRGNSIKDESALALTNSANNFPLLKSLDLSYNSISDETVIALANPANIFPLLKKLDLSDNSINDKGAIAFAKSANFQGITHLHFLGNKILDEGAIALVNSANFPKLHYFSFANNGITNECEATLLNSKLFKLQKLYF